MTQEEWAEYANIFTNILRLRAMAKLHKTSHIRSMYEVMEEAVIDIVEGLLANGVSANEQVNFLLGYGFKPEQIKPFVEE